LVESAFVVIAVASLVAGFVPASHCHPDRSAVRAVQMSAAAFNPCPLVSV